MRNKASDQRPLSWHATERDAQFAIRLETPPFCDDPTIDIIVKVSRGQKCGGHSAVVKRPVAMCPAAKRLDALSNWLVVNTCSGRSYISDELSHKLGDITKSARETLCFFTVGLT